MSLARHRLAKTALNWVEVDGGALLHNLHAFRRRLGSGVELSHVIKANA